MLFSQVYIYIYIYALNNNGPDFVHIIQQRVSERAESMASIAIENVK